MSDDLPLHDDTARGTGPDDGASHERPERKRRWPRRLALGLGAALLLLVLFILFLVATPPGARFLFGRLGAAMPGSLAVERLEGPLRGPLVLHGLVYETDTLEVRIERVLLEWQLRALLAKRLDITRLDASGVRVVTVPAEEESDDALPDIHLPINIIVRQATVEDITVGGRDAADPLTIDRLDLVTRALGDRVEIETLDVASSELSLDVAGWLEPQGDYAVELAVDWALQLAGQPPMAGSGTLAGTLAALRVEQVITAPVTAKVNALLGQPLRDLTFDGDVQAEPFPLRTFGAELPEITLGGRLRAEGAIEAFRSTADLTVDYPEIGPLRTDLAFTRDGESWDFSRAVITTPLGPTRVDASGQMRLASGEPLRFDARASWTRLLWPLASTGGDPEDLVRSPQGSLEIAGTTDDYRLTVDGRFRVAGLPPEPAGPTPLTLTGRGDTASLRITAARLQLLEGTVQAAGRVAWSPRVEWALDLEGQGLNPASLYADYPGDLALEARTAGYLAEAGPVATVAPLRVTGTLKESPLEVRGGVQLAGEAVNLNEIEARWGGAELSADGGLLPELGLDFVLRAPDLELLAAEAGGSANARGRLSGPFETPRIEVEAESEGLTWGGTVVRSLQLTADLDLAPGGRLTLDSHAEEITAAERRIEVADLDLAGTRDDHRLRLAAEAPEGDLLFVLVGGLDQELVWRGEISTLDLDLDAGPGRQLPALGRWTLAAPAPVLLARDRVDLGRLCQVSGAARLCSDGSWSVTQGWQADVEIAALPLNLAGPFLPPDVDVEGTVDGTLTARSTAEGGILASAVLQPGPGVVTYPIPAGGTERLRFARGRLGAKVDAGGLAADLDLPLPDLGSVRGDLSLPGYRLEGAPADDQGLAGRIRAEITDLSFLQAFSEQVSETAGDLTADLSLGGTVGGPRLSGEARLKNGRATLPDLGIRLTELELAATDAGGDALRLNGSVRSGEGRLTLTGSAPVVPNTERPIRMRITGQRFEAMDTHEIEMLVNPELDLTYDGQRLAIRGEVLVPEAKIEFKKAPRGAVTVSDDVIFLGADGPDGGQAAASGLPIAMEIRVILGNEVKIDALGLSAEPTGSLLLVEEPGQPTRGVGEIDISGGTFQAYGQDLTIERGRLSFNGPIDRPRIDLRAFRKAKDGVIAGLEARGTLSEPEITLWSEPTMSQSDQLSYLLLGRPIDQASSSEGSLVTNAAASLGIKGGNLLAERLAARFGLEEARIETDGGLEEASLTLGKFLTPRLYVAYGVGLFQAVNTLRIRYLLSSKWTLEATTGAEAGADVFYTIERGRGAKRDVHSSGATAENVPELEPPGEEPPRDP